MDAPLLNGQDRHILKKSVLCAAMTDDEMSSLVTRGSIITLERSEYLFERGTRAKNLFLILDGWAQITREERDGSQTVIATFRTGESLAEAPAFLGRPYPVSAQAMTPLRVLAINGEMMLTLIQGNRDVLAQTLASVYGKLHELVDNVEWLKSRTLRERLAKFLLEQAKGNDKPSTFTLPFSKSLIAAKLGTSPQQLSRTFSELQKFGVQIDGQVAQIADKDRLREMLQKD